MKDALKSFSLDLPAWAVAARLAQEVCGLRCEPAFPTAVSLVPWKHLQPVSPYKVFVIKNPCGEGRVERSGLTGPS